MEQQALHDMGIGLGDGLPNNEKGRLGDAYEPDPLVRTGMSNTPPRG